jgi:hypothetical protein
VQTAFIDIDMSRGVLLQKVPPDDVARLTFAAPGAGQLEARVETTRNGHAGVETEGGVVSRDGHVNTALRAAAALAVAVPATPRGVFAVASPSTLNQWNCTLSEVHEQNELE